MAFFCFMGWSDLESVPRRGDTRNIRESSVLNGAVVGTMIRFVSNSKYFLICETKRINQASNGLNRRN
jgi:hypothetical protein